MWSWVGPTNVPPRSDHTPPPSSWFQTRPPTRLRASRTTTFLPLAASARAAVRPAKPAPTTTASAVRERRRLAPAGDAPVTSAPAPAAAPPPLRRRGVGDVV